jgi:hypothetical protein
MLQEADSLNASSTRTDRGSGAEGEDSQELSGANRSGVGRHASASAWAVEAVWLWQMGGAGDRGILKPGAVRSQ